jgi:hypothetical protein
MKNHRCHTRERAVDERVVIVSRTVYHEIVGRGRAGAFGRASGA